jgi:hypothetical protein
MRFSYLNCLMYLNGQGTMKSLSLIVPHSKFKVLLSPPKPFPDMPAGV